MIPIECPRCGRTGKVPPDRLNARLVCKGCHAAFHMDRGGRMILGVPGAGKANKPRTAPSAADYDLAQTWRDAPRPAKIGVPSLLILVAGWIWCPNLASTPGYQRQAEVIGQALLHGDRARAVALATPESAAAAEKWYDRARAPLAEGPATPGTAVASVLDGSPEHDAPLAMVVALTTESIATIVNLQMVKTGDEWRFDAAKSLADAEHAAAPPVRFAKKH